MDLEKYIVVDHHAHSLRRGHLLVDAIGFRQSFSESRSLSQLEDHVQHSVHYLRMLNELGDYLGVDGEESLLDYRAQQSERDYINRLWDDVSIGGLIVDDGFLPDEMMPIEQIGDLCERPVYRCLRIESALEDCLIKAGSWGEMVRLFEMALHARGKLRTVAWKSIAAYRGGLDIERVSHDEARDDFDRIKIHLGAAKSVRITRSKLYHHLLGLAFEMASQEKMPVQLHSGLGDDDADLRLANPLVMREILQTHAFANAHFIFLHCYPFVSEAAYLASIYPHVYFDLSLAINLVSACAQEMVAEALAAAPYTKLLAASDGHSVPEAHWYGVRCWKSGLTGALNTMIDRGFVSETQAADIAGCILHDNARRLYDLEDLV